MTPVLARTVLAQAADAPTVRRAVEEVLARPEYADASPGQSLLDRALTAVLEGIGRLLLQVDATGPDGSILGSLALLLLVILLVILGVRALRRLRRSTVLDPVVAGPTGRSARDWGAEAAEHTAAGNHRQALRCRYRETLALLAAASLVEEIPGRTTGEYLGAVAAAVPDAEGPFGRLTRVFEGAWYGRRPVGADTVDDALSAQSDVVRAAGIRHRRTVAAVGSAADVPTSGQSG